MKAEVAALGLGSNLGDKRGNIDRAIDHLAARIRIVRRSSQYRTAPWGNTEQDWFVNACVLVETALSPHDLLEICLEIERLLGRTREAKWGPRLIDIDLLTYGRVQCDTQRLTLPHPHAAQRAFVLVPLAEIAPDLAIGATSVAEALARLDSEGVERLTSAHDPSSPSQRTVSMHKAFGVQVTVPSTAGADPVAQPMVVVARDERDAELIAAAAAGAGADAQALRELSPDEVRNYDLDLDVHGHMKALPVLDL